jgi:hypothetical protein
MHFFEERRTGRATIFTPPDMTLDAIWTLGRVSCANGDKLHYFSRNGALFFENLVLKTSECLEHAFLGFFQVFVMLTTIQGLLKKQEQAIKRLQRRFLWLLPQGQEALSLTLRNQKSR